MPSSNAKSVSLVVEDSDAGRCYRLHVAESQYRHLTVQQVQQMVSNVARSTATNSQNEPPSSLNNKQGKSAAKSTRAPTQYQLGDITYEAITTTSSAAADSRVSINVPASPQRHGAADAPSHVRDGAPLELGAFYLLDAAGHVLTNGAAAAAAANLHAGPPLSIVRRHSVQDDDPLHGSGSGDHVSSPSLTSSSAIFFVEEEEGEVGEDEEENHAGGQTALPFSMPVTTSAAAAASDKDTPRTASSVSFEEDMVSISYNYLMPAHQLTDGTATAHFYESMIPQGDEEREGEDADNDFEDISFATLNFTTASSSILFMPEEEGHHTPAATGTTTTTSHMTNVKQHGHSLPRREQPVARLARPEAALQRRLPIRTYNDPVAHKTVRQRYDYYHAEAKRKKAERLAAAQAHAEAPLGVAVTVHVSCPAPPPPPPPPTDTETEAAGAAQPSLAVDVTAARAQAANTQTNTTTSGRGDGSRRKKGKKASHAKGARSGSGPASKSASPRRVIPTAADSGTSMAGPQVSAVFPRALTTDREQQLAHLVEQLQDDVHALLAQSQTDASRIATLRNALSESHSDYRVLHEAHITSMNRLEVCTAQLVPVSAVVADKTKPAASPPPEQQQQHPVITALHPSLSMDVRELSADMDATEVEECEDAEQPVDGILGEAPRTCSPEPVPYETSEEGGEEREDETRCSTAHDEALLEGEEVRMEESAVKAAEDMEHVEAAEESPIESTAVTDSAAYAAAPIVAIGELKAAPSVQEQQEHVAETAASPSAGVVEEEMCTTTLAEGAVMQVTASPPPSPPSASSLPPIPALRNLSEEEVHTLLRQVGYIYHNRLLRRENCLLMHRLSVLQEEKQKIRASKKTKGAGSAASSNGSSGARRIRVVIRLRPAGLCSSLPSATVATSNEEATGRMVRSGASSYALLSSGPSAAVVGRSTESNSAFVSPLMASLVSPTNGSTFAAVAPRVSLPESRRGTGAVVAPGPLRTPLLSPSNNTTTFSPPMAVSESPTSVSAAPSDLLLTWDAAEGRLWVSVPDGGLTQSLRETATLRGAQLLEPPLPQSLATARRLSTSSRSISFAGSTVHEAGVKEAQEDSKADRNGVRAAAAAAQQRTLYQDTVRPLVEKLLSGESGTVLAYGPVGSGKSYTLFGDCGEAPTAPQAATPVDIATVAPADGAAKVHIMPDIAADAAASALPAEVGVIPRAIESILDQLRRRAASEELLLRSLFVSRNDAGFQTGLDLASPSSISSAATAVGAAASPLSSVAALACSTPMYELQCSMVEVYGETVRDLLAPQVQLPVYAPFTTGTTSATTAVSPVDGFSHPRAASSAGAPCPLGTIVGYTLAPPECKLQATSEGGWAPVGATTCAIHTLEEAMQLIRRGQAHRAAHYTTASTGAAAATPSHDSHTIFTLNLKQQQWWTEPAPAEQAVGTKAEAAVEEEGKRASTSQAAAAVQMGPAPKKAKRSVARATSAGTVTKGDKKKRGTTSVSRAATAAVPANMKATAVIKCGAGQDWQESSMDQQEEAEQRQYLRRRTVKSVTSRLVFVDLAGTGRGATKCLNPNEVDRRREAQAISRSLVMLGDVLSAIYCGGTGDVHIPFRVHKLTMLLRDTLLRSSNCVVVACVALSESPMVSMLRGCTGSLDEESPANEQQQQQSQFWRRAVDRALATTPWRRSAAPRKAAADAIVASGSTMVSLDSSVDNCGTVRRPLRPSAARTDARQPLYNVQQRHSSGSAHVDSAARSRLSASPGSTAASGPALNLSLARGSPSESRAIKDNRSTAAQDLKSTQPKVLQRPRAPVFDASALPIKGGDEDEGEEERKEMEMDVETGVELTLPLVEPEVDEEMQTQLALIATNAEAEDRARAGGLYITPRETLTTLTFLSRLWKV